jgi:DNA-binding NtrC family response regulator
VFLLKVTAGPDKGKMLALDWTRTSRVLVGTGHRADLSLGDPRVSRRHLSLSPDGSLLRLRDLSSRNGTKVSGVQVGEVWLTGGETIDLGDTALRVVNTGATSELGTRAESRFGRLIGQSVVMQRLYAWGERAAVSQEPLVIEGEPGTGKDLLAEAIHEAGTRGTGPFVVLSVEALRETPLAQLLADARGGSLVIEDPEELEAPVQAALAAAIPDAAAGIRWMATTRRDLDREAEGGRLAQALFLQLSGDVVQVPPLRQRHGDVELLARHFFALGGAEGRLTEELLSSFLDYEWPGNVLELRDRIDRVILGAATPNTGANANSAHAGAPDLIDQILSKNPTLSQARAELVGELEQRFVKDALARHNGNVTRAAAASGLTRRYFHLLRKKK